MQEESKFSCIASFLLPLALSYIKAVTKKSFGLMGWNKIQILLTA